VGWDKEKRKRRRRSRKKRLRAKLKKENGKRFSCLMGKIPMAIIISDSTDFKIQKVLMMMKLGHTIGP
jgi:hypothetical protein